MTTNSSLDSQAPAPRSGDANYVASRWVFLPPHIREAIITLVDAGLRQSGDLQTCDDHLERDP